MINAFEILDEGNEYAYDLITEFSSDESGPIGDLTSTSKRLTDNSDLFG